jgi:hypothetical protein
VVGTLYNSKFASPVCLCPCTATSAVRDLLKKDKTTLIAASACLYQGFYTTSLKENSAKANENIRMPGSIKAQDELIDEKTGLDQPGDEPQAYIEDESTRVMEKRIVRKLDMTLMPAVWVLYFFNYMDRNNIAYVYSFA